MLRWSNGGWCRNGEREFGFFPTDHPTGSVREMLLAYCLPEVMPSALPFAFNGGGVFYLFDMRKEAKNDEFPIVCSHVGSIGWDLDDYVVVADSFLAACQGKVDVENLLYD